jgi:hypothetical protein
MTDRTADIECSRCGEMLTILDASSPDHSKVTFCCACGHLMQLNDDLKVVGMPDDHREDLEKSDYVIEQRRRITN